MDDQLHEDDELQNTDEDDSADTVDDDDSTPNEDTDDKKKSDDPKKPDAEQVKAAQKKAWLDNIKSGKKTLDDMPDNLGWLKKDIQKDLEEPKEKKAAKPKSDETKNKIRQVMAEERAEEEFNLLVDDLKSSDLTPEQDAQLREEYENLLADLSDPTPQQKLKCLVTARRLTGLKDNSTAIRERRMKGLTLPSLSGGKKRTVVNEDKTTEMEKKLSGNLPPGFKA